MTGIREFKLRNCFFSLLFDEESVTIQQCLDPQEIVNFVKGKWTDSSNLQHTQNLDNPIIDSDRHFEKDIQLLEDESKSQSFNAVSEMALGREAITNKSIELVTKMNSFIMKGTNENTYAVQLFPKDKCNCPSTSTCYHILAAKLSLDMSGTNPKRTLNLSQLKCNSGSHNEKKSGRKGPRQNYIDVTINSVPDSELNIFSNAPKSVIAMIQRLRQMKLSEYPV